MTMRRFSRSLPMALMRARETVMSEFRPILSEHGITEQQWRVLRAVVDEPDGIGVGELAARTYLLGPSVSRILAALEARQIVRRAAIDGDARRARITVTAAGRRLFERISPDSEAAYRRLEARFGRDDLDQLYALLERLADVSA